MALLMNLTAPSMVQHNVADKTVCDNDIGFAIQNAVAFDIADEVEFATSNSFKGLFDGIRTLDVFCADVQRAATRGLPFSGCSACTSSLPMMAN